MLLAICKMMPLLARIRVKLHTVGGGGGEVDGDRLAIIFSVVAVGVLFTLISCGLVDRRGRKLKEIAAKSLVKSELAGWRHDSENCFRCGVHLSGSQHILQPLNNQGAARTYNVVELPIPCCSTCRVDVNRGFNSRMRIRSLVAGSASGVISIVAFACFSWLDFWQSLGLAVLFFLATFAVCWLMHLCLLSPRHALISSYPPIAHLLLNGFNLGRGSGNKIGVVALLFGLVSLVSGSAFAGEPSELLPKVWVPEPSGVKRMADHASEAFGSNPWLDPSKHFADFAGMLGQMFKTAADWDPKAGKSFNGSFPTFAVRVLDDRDKDSLFSQEQFLVKIRDVARASTSVKRTKMVMRTPYSDGEREPKLELSILEEYCALTNDSLAVAVMLASSNQQDHIELISKRYLNVDGRFLYLGIRDFVDGGIGEVKLRAKGHDNRLRDWEREVRECTRVRRLKEFDGDEKRMREAIELEIARTPPKPDEMEEFRRIRERIGDLDPGESDKIGRKARRRNRGSASSIGKAVLDTQLLKGTRSSPKTIAWVMVLVSAFICLAALVHAVISESKKVMVDLHRKTPLRESEANGVREPDCETDGESKLSVQSEQRGNTEGDGATVNAGGSVTFSKIPPGGAMEMLRVAYEKTRFPNPKAKDGQLAFLDAGKDGILRGILWKQLTKVIVDPAKCRFYLPEGWNLTPEIEMGNAANVIAKFAGPSAHEWASVEHLLLSPEHVNDGLDDRVNVSRVLFGRLDLHAHSDWKSGVNDCKEISFGRLSCRDTVYMKYHQADDMAAFAGTLEIESRLHRVFIVIVRRGRDSWKLEYVFPAADGVTREALGFLPEEIAAAARLFVPFETHGRAKCPLCGVGVDDPSDGNLGDGMTVWLKDFTLFDDMPKLGKGGVTLACCDACREKALDEGLRRETVEGIPDVRSQLDKGASIAEIKCGDRDVAILDCKIQRNDVAECCEMHPGLGTEYLLRELPKGCSFVMLRHRMMPGQNVVIGKGPHCDFRIGDDRMTSRTHALITYDGDAFKIECLGLHGVFLSGRFLRCGEKCALVRGDHFKLGGNCLDIMVEELPDDGAGEIVLRVERGQGRIGE